MQIRINRPLLFAHNILGGHIQSLEDFLVIHDLIPRVGITDKLVTLNWTPVIYQSLLQTGGKWVPAILKCPLFPSFPLSRTKLAGEGLDLVLTGAVMNSAELAYRHVSLEGCQATGVKVVGGDVEMSAVHGHHARLAGCNVLSLTWSNLDNINMNGCTLSGEWEGCNLVNAEIRARLEDDLNVLGCNLAGITIRLRGAPGTLLTFKRCDLSRARILMFEGAAVSFRDCRIRHTRLSGAGTDPPGYRRNASFLMIPLEDAGSTGARGTEPGPRQRGSVPPNYPANAPDHWSEGL